MSSNNQIDEFFTLLNSLRETINPTNILPTTSITQDNINILNNDLDSTQITVLPNLWLLSTYGTMIETNTVQRPTPSLNSNNNPIFYSNQNSSLRSNFNSTLIGATAPTLISPVLQHIQNNSTIPFLNISTTEQVANTINTIVDSITEIINENVEPVFNKEAVITTPPFGARAPRLRNSEPLFDNLTI